MSREIRRVPFGWEHPKENGKYVPLFEGPFSERWAAWKQEESKWNEGLVSDYAGGWEPKDLADHDCSYSDWDGECPKAEDYMPEWPEDQKTMLVMYESVTEGTPISPAFKTPEELARWLADNNASACGSETATYEQWLSTCKRGWAPSMAGWAGGGLVSGVEGLARMEDSKCQTD